MKLKMLACAIVGLSFALAAVADDKHNHAPSTATNPGFEKLKTLAGTWVNADEKGNPTDEVVSEIKVSAAGSAVIETLMPGTPNEMISVYTAEGLDIVMTHYCMLGNQPQMRAKDAKGDKLNFEFVGGTNLDPKKDMHMHSAVLTFVDDDHIQVDGIGWEDGKPAKEMCAGMKLVRKK